MRAWGHQYVFNNEDLSDLLVNAGFVKLKRCKLNESEHPELRELETRKDSKLIIECAKR